MIFFCHLVVFHSFHKEVWYPQSKEQVSGPLLLFACVLLQLQEVKYIGMPRLQVHSKGSWSLSRKQSNVNYFPNSWSHSDVCSPAPYLVTPLINIACCVVVNSKHRNEPIGLPICLKSKNHHQQL